MLHVVNSYIRIGFTRSITCFECNIMPKQVTKRVYFAHFASFPSLAPLHNVYGTMFKQKVPNAYIAIAVFTELALFVADNIISTFFAQTNLHSTSSKHVVCRLAVSCTIHLGAMIVRNILVFVESEMKICG